MCICSQMTSHQKELTDYLIRQGYALSVMFKVYVVEFQSAERAGIHFRSNYQWDFGISTSPIQ